MARRYLVRNGVPYDVAYSLPDDEVMSECIAFGILDGGEWDWTKMKWRKG